MKKIALLILIGAFTFTIATAVHAAGSITMTASNYTLINIPSDGTVSASSTSSSTGQSCDSYINTYLKIGVKNSSTDVTSLQIFLNQYEKAGLPVSGYFGALTKAAVIKYQTANSIYPSGIVLTQTRWSINDKMCPNLHFPQPKA